MANKIFKYLIGVILVLAGLILILKGNSTVGSLVLVTGFGYLGLSHDNEVMKEALSDIQTVVSALQNQLNSSKK